MDTQPKTVNAVVPEWTVGDRLRKARLSKKLLRPEVCALDPAGEITPRMLGNFEAGITAPKDSMIIKLAMLLGTDKQWLATGISSPAATITPPVRSPQVIKPKVAMPDAARRLELMEKLLLAVASDSEKFAAFVNPVVELSNQNDASASDDNSGGKS